LRVSLQADQFRKQLSATSQPHRRDGSLFSTPVRDGFPMNDRINIGSRFLPKATTRRATDDLAYTGDEQAREIVACKPTPIHGWVITSITKFA
jgi:hypothetical protein